VSRLEAVASQQHQQQQHQQQQQQREADAQADAREQAALGAAPGQHDVDLAEEEAAAADAADAS
jgi:hypothetical protein